MIKGQELWNKLYQDICNIILKNKSNLIFLIGDNQTGKTQIGELLKDKILVLDNFKGELKDIPTNKKVLVITHNLRLLAQAKSETKVIITQPNNLYISTDCCINNIGDISNLFINSDMLSILLNNSISGDWSELNEIFLQDYISKNKLTIADNVLLKTINEFKNDY